jgi:hypothetical protein
LVSSLYCFLLYLTFPVIAQAEVKTILKGTGDNYIREEQQIKIHIMSNKVIYAIYNDDDILMDAVKKTRAAHHHIEEVFTISVHGLIAIPANKISYLCFLYGCVGISVATWMMNFIMIQDWPQDIGGKPSFSYIENMPAFVPIMFEMTCFLQRT